MYLPENKSTPGRTRTCNPLVRSQVRCPNCATGANLINEEPDNRCPAFGVADGIRTHIFLSHSQVPYPLGHSHRER